MYADDQVTPLLTDDPAGFALTIDVGPLGALSLNDLSQRGVIELAEVPEPSSAALLLTGAALIAARLRRRSFCALNACPIGRGYPGIGR